MLIVSLRALIVLVMLALLGALPVLWVASAEVAISAPEFAWLRWPYLTIGVLLVLCAEAVCAAVLILLSRVKDGAIFDVRAFFWVDVMVWAGAVAAVLLLIALVPVVAITHGPPGSTPVLVAAICGAAGITLLLIVMRQLLAQATVFQTELAAVI